MTPVDRLEVTVLRVPTEQPESDGTLGWDHTTVVVVQVGAADREGLGLTYGPPACARVVEELSHQVLGSDPMGVTGTWQAMVAARRNDGRPGIVSMALSAVDVALWDLKARLLDLPLVTLLGQVRDRVEAYGSGGFTSMDDGSLVEQLRGWVDAAGTGSVKMKVATSGGSDPQRDLDRVATVREAVGGDVALFVDANGGYTRKQAVRIARPFEDLGVTWFEEPVSSDDLAGLHEVREAVDCDVAAGEYGYDLAYFHRLQHARAVDVVQVDVTRCGGITEWVRVAALAAGAGLDVSGHCAPALHTHVACAVPNVRHLEYFADHVRIDRLLLDGAPVAQAGHLAPDASRPGHGMALKVPDAGRFLVEHSAFGP